MSLPSDSDIDDAVPVNGTPGRAKTNAVLKDIVGAVSQMPDPSRLLVAVPTAPATPSSSGTPGEYHLSNDALYICVAPDEWRMSILTSDW